MNVRQKPAIRIHPFPTKKDLQGRFGLPVISTLFLLGSLLIAVLTRDPEAWVFCVFIAALYAYLASMWLPELSGTLRAYREQASFAGSSLTAIAEVLERSLVEHKSGGDDAWLTIRFAAQTRAKGARLESARSQSARLESARLESARSMKVSAKVSQELYRSAGVTIHVRYSTLDPRIALLEGEAGFEAGEALETGTP